jgi:endonuclease-3 related protein
MPPLDDAFPSVLTALVDRYGSPARDRDTDRQDSFDATIMALLGRSLGTAKGQAAATRLRDEGLLTPARLAEIEMVELRDLLRSELGSVSVKTLWVVKRLAQWLVDQGRGENGNALDLTQPSDDLREQLAAIRGISVAAADALLLHGFARPTYSVDRASYRILIRHGWIDSSATYDEARDLLTGHAWRLSHEDEAEQTVILAQLAHGMSKTGREFCRAGGPRCSGCPLEPVLPEGGPSEAES